jgi:type IV secretion system protein VirD4
MNQKIKIEELSNLFRPMPDKERSFNNLLKLIGVLLTPITLYGMLWFYRLSYRRHMKPNDIDPELDKTPLITKISMAIGGVFIWVLIFLGLWLVKALFPNIAHGVSFYLGYFAAFFVVTYFILWSFNQWRRKIMIEKDALRQFGTSRFAKASEMQDLVYNPAGIYIGDINMKYASQGHILTCAGARSGKFTNLIAPHLLGAGRYQGSHVVTDVKGEIFSVTERYQKETGREVIVLNPFGLLRPAEHTFNPLELIDVADEEDLIDECSIMAQMIVPEQLGEREPYWRNKARSWITGMIIHLMLTEEEKTLVKVWEWLRLPEKDFALLVLKMMDSENNVVKATGGEIDSIKSAEDTFGSILSTAQETTDFLKSPALQKSLSSSSFDVNKLTEGNTTLYIVIPADKLESHFQWLRVVIASTLLSCIKNPKEKVTFILDEFASLGRMPLIESFMGLSSGYNITLWPVIQNLTQLAGIYGQNWQTFIGNAAVRHYFGVNDNFTAEYISDSFGVETYSPRYYKAEEGPRYTQRHLVTPAEVRTMSADHIFIQVEQRHPFYFKKVPYYLDPELVERADENPYSPVLLPDPKGMKRFIKLPQI